MTDLYSVRWPLAVGLAYVLLALGLFAATAVGKAERNLREMQRIVRSYGP